MDLKLKFDYQKFLKFCCPFMFNWHLHKSQQTNLADWPNSVSYLFILLFLFVSTFFFSTIKYLLLNHKCAQTQRPRLWYGSNWTDWKRKGISVLFIFVHSHVLTLFLLDYKTQTILPMVTVHIWFIKVFQSLSNYL